MKLADFGPFVIFAAIYAAGTLGLPQISFLAYQVKVGEMASPLVALFGMPALLGLTLGQFIANLGIEAQPIAMLSPVFSFVGLLAIYYMRKLNTFAGCLVYVVITGLWLTYLLPTLNPGLSPSLASLSAFGGQFFSVIIGYAAYLVGRKLSQAPGQLTQPQNTASAPQTIVGDSGQP